MTPDMDRIMADHGLEQARLGRAHRPRALGGWVMWDRGHATGFRDAVEHVLTLQAGWPDLPIPEALTELRKGRGSIYFPLFEDDPVLRVECPTDGWVVVTVEGFCDRCGFPFDDMPQIGERA